MYFYNMLTRQEKSQSVTFFVMEFGGAANPSETGWKEMGGGAAVERLINLITY